jgi:hypothetical protein
LIRESSLLVVGFYGGSCRVGGALGMRSTSEEADRCQMVLR